MTTPPLPPGFVLDDQQESTPPLPPGFQLEEPEGLEIDIVGGTPVSTAQFEAENPSGALEGMGWYERYMAGVGKSIVDTGRGLRQLGVDVVGELAGDRTGLTGTGKMESLITGEPAGSNAVTRWAKRRGDELRSEADENQRLDAALTDDTAGAFGNIVGLAGQLFTPAAAFRGTTAGAAFLPTTLRGNALQGGALGAVQPVATGDSRSVNALVGSGAGAVGHGVGRLASRWTPQARQAMGEADRLGLDMKATPGEQVRQLSESARTLIPEARGDALIDIQQGVRGARDVARRGVDTAYDAARATSARVPMREVQDFATGSRRILSESGFDVDAMPGLSKRLGELEALAATPNAREAQLRALEGWRKRVTAMTPKDGSPEMAAATSLKRQYDDFVTDLFNRDMIGGDAAALKAWQDARGTASRFHATFNANTVIRNLAKQDDMTPETMRAWLFNASGSGAKSQAGAVVKRLNDILGPDSPQMSALRAEVVADLSDPLLQRTPNVRGFLDRFDTYFRKNPTLVKTLFPDGAGDLYQLQMFARGVEKRPGARILQEGDPANQQLFGSLRRFLTAKLFGHGIAEGGARMASARSLIDKLRSGTVGTQARKDILREYLGANPRQPLFPRGPGSLGAASMSAANAGEPESVDSYSGP